MTLTIHGMAASTCTQRVLTTLKELGVTDYHLRTVNFAEGEHKSADYVARLHPFGKIPVLEDSDLPGTYIFESRAIIRYIARKYSSPKSTLLGSTPSAAALVETWISVESFNYDPSASSLVGQLVFKPIFWKQDPDMSIVESDLKKVAECLDVYDRHLAGKKFLVGEEFTLADLVHLPYTQLIVTAAKHSELINDRPNVKAWWERISSRPSWTETLALSQH
ncbi:hypothetical protein HDV00_010385 [Rhizophlyctis rosea]|nr:hypothetical protein HDV00_010385 [Rhizophlyctis rosea]